MKIALTLFEQCMLLLVDLETVKKDAPVKEQEEEDSRSS